jgi:hypothetical protein
MKGFYYQLNWSHRLALGEKIVSRQAHGFLGQRKCTPKTNVQAPNPPSSHSQDGLRAPASHPYWDPWSGG